MPTLQEIKDQAFSDLSNKRAEYLAKGAEIATGLWAPLSSEASDAPVAARAADLADARAGGVIDYGVSGYPIEVWDESSPPVASLYYLTDDAETIAVGNACMARNRAIQAAYYTARQIVRDATTSQQVTDAVATFNSAF